MRAAMAGPVALLLLACAVLPAAGLNVPAPDLDDLTFPQFKAQLRWESYARAGCAVTGGCFDECLKGGLEVYDKPVGDTTGSSIYLLSKLDNPPGSECRCPPAFGNMDADKTTFTGSYSGEPLTLTVDGAGILVNWAGCAHVYAVEEQFDRDGDGMPDFLGVKGAVKDTIPPFVGTILANAISATVAATIFANVATAVVEKFLQLLSVKDVKSLAQGIDLEEVGVTGGALVPLIQQAGYLGIIGQIGGRGSVPAVTLRLSEGLAWTNFHLPWLFSSYTTDSAPAVQKRRNLVASRRRDMRRMGFRLAGANISEANKCAKVEKSASELRGTVSSVAIAVGAAFATRTRDHVQGILELPYDDLIAQGKMTWMQFFGFTALTVPSVVGAASKNLAGSKELPTVMKSFMGLSEAALEATASGCPQYLAGGIVVLVVVVLLLLFIAFYTRPSGPVQENTSYTRTGPQPVPFLDQYVPLPDYKEHAVLELLPGQTWELVKQPRGEQVTGSRFGAGVPMQGMTGHWTAVPSVMMSTDLTQNGGLARQTHVEMVSITIGGAAMGAEGGEEGAEGGEGGVEGEPIEDEVQAYLNSPQETQEKKRLENEIYLLQEKINDMDKQLDRDRKKKPATNPRLLSQKQKELDKDKKELIAMETRLLDFPEAQKLFLEKTLAQLKNEKPGAGGDTSAIERQKNDLDARLQTLIKETQGREYRFEAEQAKTMELLLEQIKEEKDVIKDAGLETSATLVLLRKNLETIWSAKDYPFWMRQLILIIMLPSVIKQYVINEIIFYASSKVKEKDPSKAKGDKFVGPMTQFPNFGGHKPKSSPAAQVCTSVQRGACSRVEAVSECAGVALCRRLWGASVHCSRSRQQRKCTTRSGTTRCCSSRCALYTRACRLLWRSRTFASAHTRLSHLHYPPLCDSTRPRHV
jgi:hypothetical protein